MTFPKKPLNTKPDPCVLVSSSCVSWQGGDLCCIKICKNDSVTDIIKKLSDKMCKMSSVFDMEHYEFGVLLEENATGPDNFIELIQLIIDSFGSNTSTVINQINSEGESIITVAGCFTEQLGESTTLFEYVQAIGEKVCAQNSIIENQQTAISQLTSQVEALTAQVQALIGG